jgi:hypothetical protein
MSTSQTVDYSGGWTKFVVPEGRTQVHINASGAGSGTRRGGRVAGTLPCNPGDVLWISVGGHGKAANGRQGGAGGFGGGGPGGDGTGPGDGGRGGGGATVVRLDSRTGTIVAVAGGAGGSSGDSGPGGQGGANNGQEGGAGTSGSGQVFDAQGGSQTSEGNGGKSGGGAKYAGEDAEKGLLGRGGRGGQVGAGNSNGGGGGGGGYRGGGGGQASATQDNPGGSPTRRFAAGGGGGGSNYANPRLRGITNARGTGAEDHGQVVLTYSESGYVNNPPTPPTDIFVNGVAEEADMATKSLGTVEISAAISDSNIGQRVRLLAQVLEPRSMFGQVYQSAWTELTENAVGQNAGTVRVPLTMTGLPVNTLFKLHLWSLDEVGQVAGLSNTFSVVSFWTNRPPDAPELNDPDDNSTIPSGTDITFGWTFIDPDGGNTPGGYQVRWRTSATPSAPAGEWLTVTASVGAVALTANGELFRGNTSYDWTVRTPDPEGMWGPWQISRSFFVVADVSPPVLTSPIGDQAVQVGVPTPFTWTFLDPSDGATQLRADLRYRVVGTEVWVTLTGENFPGVPGAASSWDLTTEFGPGLHYEWQVKTYSSSGLASEWSTSATFWTISAPGGGLPPLGDVVGRMAGPLGYGTNRAYVYRRGGQIPVGELTGISKLQWDRRRDDTSEIDIVIDNFDESLKTLLAQLHTWAYEIVIWRDGPDGLERVAEGPITLLDDRYDTWEIQAKDVTAYLSRRVLRQGYADGYQIVGNTQVGLRTVVERAELDVINGLAYDDPNVIPYLTALKNDGDARQSRNVPDHSRMVLEDIDDLASNAGLDYTTVGRRIILWDTHRMIGRLPEMRNSDFMSPPRITEYGAQACNYYAVTDGSGVYGTATRGLDSNGQPIFYGWLEMLASAYGTDPDEVADASLLTSEAREALANTFSEQAQRNIAHRWPAPKQVKVAENTRLNPEINLSINQLVPGVWIPVRAKSRVLEIAQWQKLDRVTVVQTEDGEEITVSMAPAPNNGADPDSEESVE